jgi:hypothetical protein
MVATFMDTAHLVNQDIKQSQPVFTETLMQRAVQRYGGRWVDGEAEMGESLQWNILEARFVSTS